MPRRVVLPPSLNGAAHRVDDSALAVLGRGRLRGSDVAAPFRGVRTFGVDIESIEGRCLAYTPLLGGLQVFCGVTAALLLRMPLPLTIASQGELHVGAVGGAQPRRGKGVRGHRVPRGTAIWRVGDLRVTSPIATWCQLAGVLSKEDLTAIADFLVSGLRENGVRHPALATVEQLHEAAAASGGKRGSPALRWACEHARAGVDSRPETLLRLLLLDAGFPEPVVGLPVATLAGALTLHPDLAWPEIATIWRHTRTLARGTSS